MKEGPDIALLGSLIGDPARANMLMALMAGKALTATELAAEAGVTVQTASSHLSKLEHAQLISPRKQGRHKYFTLSNEDVGDFLENMLGLAAKQGYMRTRTGPKDEDLRRARVCYDHLAGELGVKAYDSLLKHRYLLEVNGDLRLTASGKAFFDKLGIDTMPMKALRRPLCKACLDWSARRSHLAGSLGTALIDKIFENGWAKRRENSRIVTFTREGEKKFSRLFS
ncbi:MAG: winged helix-turn-helix transcriptional regulator [Kordiimonadaceae bacterium]|nr:winged helix-turn-helix transcriptional regulator [Kordiimonadaceae bacterium]